MSLYDLTTDWQKVYDMEDLDAETWADTLESIEGEIKDKAVNIGYVVKNLEADEAALAAEIKRLQDKKKAVIKKKQGLKDYLQSSMYAVGLRKIQSAPFNIRIQKNTKSLTFDNEEQFMKNEFYDNYFIPQPPRLDKKQMLEDLKNGAVIEGVELRQSESLRF
ncbi:siphovirus Gp157 family protein [Lactococcus garvieae]|uniref:siphovirus Gp157 family protein n=1 Tax=Lactococcus garvieae TaxID=1363 RepID=UPI001F62511E|nr:siphovirus Gp157 family protein [Lactococcus garvieae]MCI3860179.1 siphovirus Gp157 family protein [Lactococcus garvieae]